MNMKSAISQLPVLLERARVLYGGLSERERKLLAVGILVTIVIAVLAVTQPIRSIFAEQNLELEKVIMESQQISTELTRYQRLISRRREVEQEFKSVELKDGALSHLEGLIRDKAGIGQGAFTIKDQAPRPFGNDYQQTFFTVNFATTDYPKLIDFLQELVAGKQPLLLKRLSLKRSRGGEKLDVDIEVSSISK
jgi:hypothetical protein